MADRDLHTDIDPAETQEWRDALTSVLEREGETRAHYLLEELIDLARRSGVYIPYRPTTAYLNTIRAVHEERSPGDAAIEWRIRSLVRWNALAMVDNANRESSELGGHIASFALRPGNLRPRISRGTYQRVADEGFSAGSVPGRSVVIPPPVADAGLLAVPHGLNGARADPGHLPGAFYALSAAPGNDSERRPQGLGLYR